MSPPSPPPDSETALADEPALAADDDIVGVPTLPEAEAETVAGRAARLVRELDDVVGEARASIPGWDNLAWVHAFARAATRAKELLPTTTHALERRAIAARLLRLVPPALLPVGGRDHASFFALPDEVALRADDDFAFVTGDAPTLHPSWSAFLTRKDVLEGVLHPGRHERLLAPRSLSPGAHGTVAPTVGGAASGAAAGTASSIASNSASSTASSTTTGPASGSLSPTSASPANTTLPASTMANSSVSRPSARAGSALLVQVEGIAAGTARLTVHGSAGPSSRRLKIGRAHV